MDGQKFDELIRSICTTRLTRLSALRGLVAGAAASVTGLSLASDGEAAKKKGKKAKKSKKAKKRGASKKTVASGGGGSRLGAQAIVEDCATVVGAPSLVTGNPDKCNGGFRVAETDTSGTITGACGCKIAWEIDENGFSFGPTGVAGDTVCNVSSIVVKGGNNANLYDFGTPGVTCANGLVAPDNASGKPAGISHVDVCGVTCCVPLTCQTDGGDVACGDDVDDTCGGTIDCTCPDDNNGCTTETCDQPIAGEPGTCSSTNVTCNPTNGCEEDCVCVSDSATTHHCECDEVVCIPGECEENCICVSDSTTTHHCECDDACACDESCTLGYYAQNTCNWPGGISPTDLFPCNPTLTYAQALACRGSKGSCTTLQAQQAAALLNLAAFGCIDDEDLDTQAEICASTSTADLKAVNDHDPKCCADQSCADNSVCVIGRTCPLAGCGNS